MPDWQERAACAGDLRFTDRPQHETQPVCAGCPVRFDCLEFGIGQASGTDSATVGFGGVSPAELTRIARQRKRARPLVLAQCTFCGDEFWGSRARIYCSNMCRQRAYGARKPRSPRKQVAA